MPANLENSAVATGLIRSVFIPILKKGNAKKYSNYHPIALISQASEGMLKILQARLQQYHELSCLAGSGCAESRLSTLPLLQEEVSQTLTSVRSAPAFTWPEGHQCDWSFLMFILPFLCDNLSHFWHVAVFMIASSVQVSSVQSLSRVRLFVTPWTAACQASLSITNSRSLPKPMSIKSRWCHSTISSSVAPFSSRLQSFPESGSFQISQLFVSDVQSIGVSASASVLPVNTQDWSPLGWTG